MADLKTGIEYNIYIADGKLIMAAETVGLEIISYPDRMNYYYGDSFDPTGMQIGLRYQNGDILEIEDYIYTEVLEDINGIIKIQHIDDLGREYELEFSVNVATPVELEIISYPNQMDYYAGEMFNPEGMIIGLRYSNGDVIEIEGYTYTEVVRSNGRIDIEYIDNYDEEYDLQFNVNVYASIVGIEVTQMPNKIDYYLDDPFDPTGMIVEINFSDGSSIECDDYTYDQTVSLEGVQIYYTDGLNNTYTCALALNVINFSPTNQLIDFEYYFDETENVFVLTGWKGTLNGVSSGTMQIPDSPYVKF